MELAAGFRAFVGVCLGSMVGFRLLVLLLVRPPPTSGCFDSIAESPLREFCRARIYEVAALPCLPQRLCSPIPEEGSGGENAAQGCVREAVSLCGVRVEIFAAVDSCEF